MKRFTRPYRGRPFLGLGFAGVLGLAVCVGMPQAASAQVRPVTSFLEEASPLLARASTPGYLGVDIGDVDNEKAQALKLKDARGAVITLIDHDAPAGQAGLKVNDVVLQMNGQAVENAEQLRRMIKEIPAGRKVALQISRDGNLQTLTVELVDRKAMEQEVWNKLGSSGSSSSRSSGMGILSGNGLGSLSGFHMPFFGSSLNVGALVEPLTSQMAGYLGVTGGVMVKEVARKSAAAAAGLRAFDVILKVGSEAITTSADWERSLHSNQGKSVQVTILRDKKQVMVTLQVDSKRHQGTLGLDEWEQEKTDSTDDNSLLSVLGKSGLTSGSIQSLLQQLPEEDMKSLEEKLKEQIQVSAQPSATAAKSQQNLQSPGGSALLSLPAVAPLPAPARLRQTSLPLSGSQLDSSQFNQMKQQMSAMSENLRATPVTPVAPIQIDNNQANALKQNMDAFKRQMEEMKVRNFGAQR